MWELEGSKVISMRLEGEASGLRPYLDLLLGWLNLKAKCFVGLPVFLTPPSSPTRAHLLVAPSKVVASAFELTPSNVLCLPKLSSCSSPSLQWAPSTELEQQRHHVSGSEGSGGGTRADTVGGGLSKWPWWSNGPSDIPSLPPRHWQGGCWPQHQKRLAKR